MLKLDDYVSDYCTSEHFFFLDSSVKLYAESILLQWCKQIDTLNPAEKIEDAMMNLGTLDLSFEIKKAIPDLLSEFCEYLVSTGKYPLAQSWSDIIVQTQQRFFERLREDGSFKGETYIKKYTHTNRNDPCPCGSGKKFKKCCMPLLS